MDEATAEVALTRLIADPSLPPSASLRPKEIHSRLKRSAALFEGHDGPLVEASRADESVLGRLNSVLEPARTLILGGWDISHVEITATEAFKLIATMNPGGDYGKKELSPALRNRFTEIWVLQVESRADKMKILDASWASPNLKVFGSALLDFSAGSVPRSRIMPSWV